MRRTVVNALAPATISEFDGVRYLHLDTPWVQGAMRLGRPLDIELDYVQRMMAWMLLLPTEALAQRRGRAVQLGLGAGAITRYTHKVLGWPTTAVELNPSVIAANRQWFRLPAASARFAVLEADAGDWVADADHTESVRALCVDLYDHEAAAPVLDTDAFYADCHRVLEPGGVFSVNLFGRDASFVRSAGRIATAFGAAQVCSLRPTREGNTVVIARKVGGDSLAALIDRPQRLLPERAVLVERAAAIERDYGLKARGWLKMLRPLPEAAPS